MQLTQYYLNCGALIREWTIEECTDDVHYTVDDVIFQGCICMFPVMRGICDISHVHQETFFEEAPHMV
jgi:hypothetical protein